MHALEITYSVPIKNITRFSKSITFYWYLVLLLLLSDTIEVGNACDTVKIVISSAGELTLLMCSESNSCDELLLFQRQHKSHVHCPGSELVGLGIIPTTLILVVTAVSFDNPPSSSQSYTDNM